MNAFDEFGNFSMVERSVRYVQHLSTFWISRPNYAYNEKVIYLPVHMILVASRGQITALNCV